MSAKTSAQRQADMRERRAKRGIRGVHIYLTNNDRELLKLLSDQLNCPISDVVGEALRWYAKSIAEVVVTPSYVRDEEQLNLEI